MRIFAVSAERKDAPTKYCNKHVSVDYCPEGKAPANEYCKKFAEAKKLELGQKSLVKLTKTQINEMVKAKGYGLSAKYVNEYAVYQVNSSGEDSTFKGFDGDKENTGPYLTCTVHTKAAWEKLSKEEKEDKEDKDKTDKDKTDKDKTDKDKTDKETTETTKKEEETKKPTETKPAANKETKPAGSGNESGETRGLLGAIADIFQ